MKNSRLLLWLMAMVLLIGCKSTEYVPVVHTNTEHHWHTDSVMQRDSVINEKETIIMQLDSEAMAAYGIKLKQAERAWLVKTKELERQLEQLMQLSVTRDTVRDTIPQPYPVKEYVEKPLKGWQRFLMWTGVFALAVLMIIVGRWYAKWPY